MRETFIEYGGECNNRDAIIKEYLEKVGKTESDPARLRELRDRELIENTTTSNLLTMIKNMDELLSLQEGFLSKYGNKGE